MHRNVLVTAGQLHSAVLQWKSRNTAVCFAQRIPSLSADDTEQKIPSSISVCSVPNQLSAIDAIQPLTMTRAFWMDMFHVVSEV
eukprot:m.20366 g.20366  ORF g.20366 m.20366 type:complete len:84 (+) comp12127_c0_seq1:3654-3905(+)